MIDIIYSVNMLKRSLVDIPEELDYIFKSCDNFLGDMYIYKVFMNDIYLVLITNIPRHNLSVYDKMEFLKVSDEIQNKNKDDNNFDQIHKWRSRTIYF